MGVIVRHFRRIFHFIDIGEDVSKIPQQVIAVGRKAGAGDRSDIVLHIDFRGIGNKRRCGQRHHMDSKRVNDRAVALHGGGNGIEGGDLRLDRNGGSALSVAPVEVVGSGMCNVKRGTKLPEYPEKPFLEKFEAEKKEKVQKKQQEDQMKLAMAMFHAGIAKFNKRFEEERK